MLSNYITLGLQSAFVSLGNAIQSAAITVYLPSSLGWFLPSLP
jgi:hypothetical protein